MSSGANSTTPRSGATVLCPVSECHLPIDIILVSSDGTELGAHRVSLEDSSGGFAKYLTLILAEDGVSKEHDEPRRVGLTEKADSLRYVLQLTHNTSQHPDLARLPSGVLAKVAEAFEKYAVFSAMLLCKSEMTRRAQQYPIIVLSYAVKHGHIPLADRAAKRALEVNYSIDNFISQAYGAQMPEQDIIKWIIYRNKYSKAADAAFHYSCGVESYTCKVECSNWGEFQAKVLHRVSHSLLTVMQFSETIASLQAPWVCVTCTSIVEDWIKCVEGTRPSTSLVFSDIDLPQ